LCVFIDTMSKKPAMPAKKVKQEILFFDHFYFLRKTTSP
jgi:hypothetical protein